MYKYMHTYIYYTETRSTHIGTHTMQNMMSSMHTKKMQKKMYISNISLELHFTTFPYFSLIHSRTHVCMYACDEHAPLAPLVPILLPLVTLHSSLRLPVRMRCPHGITRLIQARTSRVHSCIAKARSRLWRDLLLWGGPHAWRSLLLWVTPRLCGTASFLVRGLLLD